MLSRALYNEIDERAATVLRQLIAENVIAPGDVNTTSIKELTLEDLKGYTQVHFFAGGGLWSVAARLAGWPDDRPLWTGSCPCQPFSVSGKGERTSDPRHLWPDFLRLIRAARPSVVMGEQVAGTAGYDWFDRVRSDLEGEEYTSRAVDIPTCSVGSPHQRQRLYWVGSLADRARFGPQVPTEGCQPAVAKPRRADHSYRSMWHDAEIIRCSDGKHRRCKPRTPMLVDGFPGRLAIWSIAGNAISPILAAEVIAAFLEANP